MTLARTLRPIASRHPRVVLLAGSFDLQAPATEADLHLNTHCALLDTVVEATAGTGLAGNNITVTVLNSSGMGVGVVITVTGTDVLIEYEEGVSTVLDVENAITALAGANDIIGVKTAGTGANILGANASHVHCDTDLGCAEMDLTMVARESGAAWDGSILAVYGDSGAGVGAYATWTEIAGGPLGVLEIHYEDSVSTQGEMAIAVNALVGCPYYAVAPTPAGAISAAGDTGLAFATHGGAVGDNMATHYLAGGTGYVPITSWRGMKECTGIAHPAVGRYVLGFKDSYPAILDFEACLQLITAAAQQVQVGAFSAVNRTVEVRVVNTATGALEDPAVAAGDRINVTALVSNTKAGRLSTV